MSNVAFHIGRGGHFNNPGHKSYIPYVETLQKCFNSTDCLINEDENGNILPDNEWKLVDGSLNVLLEGKEEIESTTVCIDRDNSYDTDIVKDINDCTEEELSILFKAYLNEEPMNDDVKTFVCNNEGYRRISSIKFYKGNAIISFDDEKGTKMFTWDGQELDYSDIEEYLESIDCDPISIKKYSDELVDRFTY